MILFSFDISVILQCSFYFCFRELNLNLTVLKTFQPYLAFIVTANYIIEVS